MSIRYDTNSYRVDLGFTLGYTTRNENGPDVIIFIRPYVAAYVRFYLMYFAHDKPDHLHHV